MRAHPDCGIAGAQLLNPDGSRQNSIANFPSLATEPLNKSLLRRIFPRRFPGKEQRFTSPVPVETVIGAFMLIRAELWRELGGFDERYFFFFEETDFCLQARRRGWQVFHLPQVQVWHEQGKESAKPEVPVPVRIGCSALPLRLLHQKSFPPCVRTAAGGLERAIAGQLVVQRTAHPAHPGPVRHLAQSLERKFRAGTLASEALPTRTGFAAMNQPVMRLLHLNSLAHRWRHR